MVGEQVEGLRRAHRLGQLAGRLESVLHEEVEVVALWRDRRFRSLALAYPVLCVLTLALGGKPYYTMSLLVLLVAAGAEPAWRWVLRHRVWASAAAVAGALVSVLIALPVLPVGALGPVLAVNPEQGEQVGWRELTASVAQAWAQAGPGAVIFTHNYGQAGAVERYGPEYGLPQPYSGHMSYADWGPPPDSASGRVVVVDPATQHSPAASSSSRMTPSSRTRRTAPRSPYVIQSTGHGCGRNCAGSMAERRTDRAHRTREVSCCSCRDDVRPPRRSIGEDSPSERIVVMARITGGHRRVGLPESPYTKQTPCLKCRPIGTRSPRHVAVCRVPCLPMKR